MPSPMKSGPSLRPFKPSSRIPRSAGALLRSRNPRLRIQTTAAVKDRELRALIEGASVGRIFESIIEHRATDGREKEVQDHYKLGGNQIPLSMLRTEQRAVTAAPADVGQSQAPVVPGVFPMSVAAFLGVDMPVVPVGDAVFPVLTKNASVEALG